MCSAAKRLETFEITEDYFIAIRSFGLTAPLTVRLRISMELTWRTTQQWNKHIPEEHLAELHQGTSEFNVFEKIEL